MSQDTITDAKQQITQALRESYGIRPKKYDAAMKKARGYLPYRLRKEAAYLDEAEADLRHPLKRRHVDMNRVTNTRKKIMLHAYESDVAGDRVRGLFAWGSEQVIRLGLAFAIIYFVARWLGAI